MVFVAQVDIDAADADRPGRHDPVGRRRRPLRRNCRLPTTDSQGSAAQGTPPGGFLVGLVYVSLAARLADPGPGRLSGARRRLHQAGRRARRALGPARGRRRIRSSRWSWEGSCAVWRCLPFVEIFARTRPICAIVGPWRQRAPAAPASAQRVLTYDPAGEGERSASRRSGTRDHDKLKGDNDEQNAGIKIIARAVEEPLRAIVANDSLHIYIERAIGSLEKPLMGELLKAKFVDQSAPIIGQAQSDQAWDLCMSLAAQPNLSALLQSLTR